MWVSPPLFFPTLAWQENWMSIKFSKSKFIYLSIILVFQFIGIILHFYESMESQYKTNKEWTYKLWTNGLTFIGRVLLMVCFLQLYVHHLIVVDSPILTCYSFVQYTFPLSTVVCSLNEIHAFSCMNNF